jgi:lipoyl(octanoyl) transferase
MHGFALNVSPDLSPYAGIVPCGLRDRGVTALARLAPGVAMASVIRRTVHRFADCFGYAEVLPSALPALPDAGSSRGGDA